MAKSYIKICYLKRSQIGLPMPFYHTSLEARYAGKIIKKGHFAHSVFLWCLSILFPVLGEQRFEHRRPRYSITLSSNPKKAKKVFELMKSRKYHWKFYMALFRNCFHWRNAILKEAGLDCPRGDWFWKIK